MSRRHLHFFLFSIFGLPSFCMLGGSQFSVVLTKEAHCQAVSHRHKYSHWARKNRLRHSYPDNGFTERLSHRAKLPNYVVSDPYKTLRNLINNSYIKTHFHATKKVLLAASRKASEYFLKLRLVLLLLSPGLPYFSVLTQERVQSLLCLRQ